MRNVKRKEMKIITKQGNREFHVLWELRPKEKNLVAFVDKITERSMGVYSSVPVSVLKFPSPTFLSTSSPYTIKDRLLRETEKVLSEYCKNAWGANRMSFTICGIS